MQYDYGFVYYVHCERGVEGVDMVDGIYGAMCFHVCLLRGHVLITRLFRLSLVAFMIFNGSEDVLSVFPN
jgi:hypothetical protein